MFSLASQKRELVCLWSIKAPPGHLALERWGPSRGQNLHVPRLLQAFFLSFPQMNSLKSLLVSPRGRIAWSGLCSSAISGCNDGQPSPWESSESCWIWTTMDRGEVGNCWQKMDLARKAPIGDSAFGWGPHLWALPLWMETKYSNLTPRSSSEAYFNHWKVNRVLCHYSPVHFPLQRPFLSRLLCHILQLV